MGLGLQSCKFLMLRNLLGTKKVKVAGFRPRAAPDFLFKRHKKSAKTGLPCGRHFWRRVAMDLMSRSGPMVQPTAALSWLRKPKAPTSLRSHGLNGGGAAFYLSGVTVQPFFVGAAFSRE
jgi:hypothetical protein